MSGVAELVLSKGQVAIIDESCIGRVPGKWYAQWSSASRTFYAKQCYVDSDGVKRNRYLHRVLLNAQHGEQVDHIDHNGLNNRLSNLRIVTQSQNNANSFARSGSKYKGVDFDRNKKAWRAQFAFGGTHNFLGHYETEDDAALAYNAAAFAVHGGIARLNQVPGKTESELVIAPERRCVYSSKVSGVSRHSCGRWRAYLPNNGKQIHIGMFATEGEAITARQQFVLQPTFKEKDHGSATSQPVNGIGEASTSSGQTQLAR